MKTFEATVEQLIHNEIGIEEACSLLEFWAESYAGDTQTYKKASEYLDNLYTNHKISDSYQSKILSCIQPCSGDSQASTENIDYDDDATVIAQLPGKQPKNQDEDEDATIIADINLGDNTIQLEGKETASTSIPDINLEDDDDEDDGKLKPGSILKDRFNLVSLLGEGGMGMVYKAIDMLKVEAKDMNPYVAIKVLSEDFKEHPDAFISLQRETSKAQKLAHPNIATVYDFDRDKETVYMTMELLEGKPLDEFIKSMPKEGLSEEEALEIITGLGEGLAYAHANGLVHSDFKPGNAFILYDGPVKVIDFGIARAAGGAAQTPAPDHDISKTGLETDLNPAPTDNTAGVTTDFDAGTLGALTPAYATVEMFEGKEPAPSDDIYALACVAVQLLTGKHPFKKRTAPKAKEKGMKPPVIDGFTKRQQRALEKALEFTREKRTETMEEFLDGIRRRKNYTKQIVLGTVVTLALIGGFGYKPITNYYEQEEIDKIILQANNGSTTRLLQTLASLKQYKTEKSNAIKNGIKEKALQIYTEKIQEAFNVEQEQYEFETATGFIDEALSYYPDSAAIKDLSVEIVDQKSALIEELQDKYMEQLLSRNLLADDSKDDMTDTLKLLKKIAPEDEAFKDPRLEFGYYDAAQKSIQKKQFETASIYLATGLEYVPQSLIYKNISDEIILNRLKNQISKAQVQSGNSIPEGIESISELRPYINDLVILSLEENNNEPAYRNFRQLFKNEFKRLSTIDSQQAEELLQLFSAALPTNELIEYSEQLEVDNIDAATTDNKIFVKTHFINNDTDLEKLIDHIAAIRSSISQYKINALTHYNLDYETSAESLGKENRAILISYYNDMYRSLLTVANTEESANNRLNETTQRYKAELMSVKLEAGIENQKRIFRNIAAESRLKDSVETYEKIVNNTDDTEFIEYAQKEISRMYSNLAESNANDDNYENAFINAQKAKEYFSNEYVEKQIRVYKKEISTKEVARLVLTREEEDKINAEKLLKTLKLEYPDDYSFIVNKIGYLINFEIIPLAKIDLLDAHRLKEYALSVVNSKIIANVSIEPLPKPSKFSLQGKIEVSQKNLTAAKTSLNRAIAIHPSHYQVDELREMLNEQVKVADDIYKKYIKYFSEEKYDKADKALNDSIAQWKDNPSYNKERLYYDRIMKQVKANAKLCRKDLQGIGKQTRGACNDVVLSLKKPAPTMVVVPAISIKSEPYAIGKYEISIKELNNYCESTNQCTKNTTPDQELPATNVPKEIIESYTSWLSTETGFNYQIASHDQWLNAASSGGREGNSNYNCRLRLGTKLIKGQNIVPVKSGSVNNWGLINYVGNVDEIVKADNGYILAGGNFSDSISDCKISLEKPFTGNSNTTGFRLVRNLE
ncbi:MAG: bifunctional serine/threonine-protein kinase/formylglycine-generating enzyme family protein [Gammaproteobacteria bacterium]|nr:bifunctional serine/threonine-protein kinase/formylglycine-generating enzyme family protein [Gammaproteobacteria bacterium]MCW8922508.1 bifunctional serine/threonine-protein kinase/formylglycine-generating enzyme family protein [Gammaproteobacteria bacterium]